MNMSRYILCFGVLLFVFSCDEESDTTFPTVTITFPNDETVSELVSITCISSDNEEVDRVELWVDGVSTEVIDNSEPYSLDWNTTLYDDGTHLITVRSYDVSNNKTDSEPISLVVDNSVSYPDSIDINSISFNNGGLTIDWNQSLDGDFQFYELEKSLESIMDNNYDIIYTTDNIMDTTFFDNDINPLEYQYYRITVIDTFGYKTKGNIISSSLDPIPSPVNITSVSYTFDEMTVLWEESMDNDFKNYNLLYNQDTIGTYIDKSITSYITTEFDPTQQNYFQIMVTDTLNQTSIGNGMSNSIDSFPTQINISSITYDSNEMIIDWNQSSDNDFISYELLYSNTQSGDKTSIETINDINTTSYIISDFDPTQERWYWIKVTDYWGQTTIGNGYMILDDFPISSELFPIQYEDDSFIISWSLSNEYDFKSYKLYESYSEDMSGSTIIFETDQISDTSYVRNNVNYEEIRYYQLVIDDYWEQQSNSQIIRGDSYPKIVYIRSSGNDGYLHRVNVDGTGNVELDNDVTIGYYNYYLYRQPRFYDNGKKIGYVSGTNIVVMDLDGSNKVIIDGMLNGYSSVQHNDLISYKFNDGIIVFNNNEQKIYSMTLDGNNLNTLFDYSNLGSGIGELIISPDGQKVLYSRQISPNGNYYNYLYIVDIDGSNNTQIVEIGSSPFELNFTPDGNQIIWTSYGFVSGEISLMKIDVDGSNLTQIVGIVDGGPLSISNNGNKIIFEKEDNLWIVDIDGSNLNQLTNHDYISLKNCQFSKNDDRILYDRTDGNYIMNIDGSNHIQLSDWGGWTHLSVIQPIP